MKNNKIAVIGIVLSAVIFGGSLAYSEGVTKFIGVDEAIQLAKQDNVKIKAAQASMRNAISAESVSSQTYLSDAVRALDTQLSGYQAWRLANMKARLASDNEQYTEDVVAMDTKKMYMDVYKAQKAVEAAQASFKITQQTLKQTNVKFKVGMISKKDVLDAQVQVAQADTTVKQLQSTSSLALYRLKRQLGYTMDTVIALKDSFTFVPLYQPVNIDEAAESLFQKTISYKSLKMQKEAYEDVIQKGKDINAEATPTYQVAGANLDQTNVTIDSNTKNAALAIYSFFNTLKTKEYTINSLKTQITAAQEALRIAQLQFKSGITTALAVDGAALQLQNLQTQLISNTYDYEFMKEQYEQNMFLDSF